jgi:hypothetical protein
MKKPDQWSAIWKIAGIACAILPATWLFGASQTLARIMQRFELRAACGAVFG